jgi:PKHD-type hydroxylase
MPITKGQQMLSTDIAATLFLSDPQQYVGGELSIETSYGAQQIKLNSGDMILYPANSLHQVNPVTQGSRVAGWPLFLGCKASCGTTNNGPCCLI